MHALAAPILVQGLCSDMDWASQRKDVPSRKDLPLFPRYSTILPGSFPVFEDKEEVASESEDEDTESGSGFSSPDTTFAPPPLTDKRHPHPTTKASSRTSFQPQRRPFSMPGPISVSANRPAMPTTLLEPERTTAAPVGRTISPRRVSSTSGASAFEEATPTLASIADDREANARTPRPHTTQNAASTSNLATSFPGSASSSSRIMQWQQRRDPSDMTIDARDPINSSRSMDTSFNNTMEAPSYPSDSLGRLSTASSGFGMNSSEYGHERISSSASALRKSRKIAPPELLVVVRPPPSKQTNPLNLQIQLVTPPQGPGAAPPRTSGENSRDDANPTPGNTSVHSNGSGSTRSPARGELRRSTSMSSSRSGRSDGSSTGYSTTSASSTGRRVTPLYNLGFHAIMATTVTDAGTDQKVAKFGRKGVEIDGFGTLVPHELSIGVNDLATIERRRQSFVPSIVGSLSGSELNSPEGRSEVSQTRSTEATTVFSEAGEPNGNPNAASPEPPTSFDAMSPRAKDASVEMGGGLGGKLLRGFKRFSVNAASVAASPAKSAASIRSGSTMGDSGAPASLLAKVTGANSRVKDGESSIYAGTVDDTDVKSIDDHHSDIPQLIVGAGLKGEGMRRTQGYYWTVRRWNRRLGELEDDIENMAPGRGVPGSNPILNSVWKRFNVMNRMGGSEIHPPASQIPVRFEWTRNETPKRTMTSASSSSHGAGRHGRAATDMGSGRSNGASDIGRRPSVRASFDARSASSHDHAGDMTPASEMAHGAGNNALRPPTAGSRPSSLYGGAQSPKRASMDRTSAIGSNSGDGNESDPEDSETTWTCHLVLGPTTRIPIGSLAPTPHHPKLVAQLTIPYPLPDLSQSGLGIDGAGLTREELKDIISVTCLFVIIREAFGGLAKRRKGDNPIKFGAAVHQR